MSAQAAGSDKTKLSAACTAKSAGYTARPGLVRRPLLLQLGDPVGVGFQLMNSFELVRYPLLHQLAISRQLACV